jgi:Protein of unknown function (DUF664)
MPVRFSFAAFDIRLTPFIGSPRRRPFHRFITGSSTPKGTCGERHPAHHHHDDLTLRRNDTWVVGRPYRDVRHLGALVAQIAEYARHCGHADLLPERIDGRVGQ